MSEGVVPAGPFFAGMNPHSWLVYAYIFAAVSWTLHRLREQRDYLRRARVQPSRSVSHVDAPGTPEERARAADSWRRMLRERHPAPAWVAYCVVAAVNLVLFPAALFLTLHWNVAIRWPVKRP